MKEQILQKYPFKTELHCHTRPVSGCSSITAQKLVELYEALGVDTIVLTNHYYNHYYADSTKQRPKEEAGEEYLQGFRELQTCAEEKGIAAVLGMEIRFQGSENDYLVYGLTEEDVLPVFDYLSRDLEHFYKEYKKESKLIFQAHPFRDGMVLADPKHLDGIEVFNMHPRHNSRVAPAAHYAQQQGLLAIGGSDSHREGDEGCCLLRTKQRITTGAELVAVLKSKDYVLEVFGSIILP